LPSVNLTIMRHTIQDCKTFTHNETCLGGLF